MKEFDLFGNEIVKKNDLREMFSENPFSILDAKSGKWQSRKNKWLSLGIKSEIGRDAKTWGMKSWSEEKEKEGKLKVGNLPKDTSIFDPYLCEIIYRWFCVENGMILDPFAGGSVRGIVANYLGFKYTGIDIRQEQINSDIEQSSSILDIDNQPKYICGDSNKVLDNIKNNSFDLVFSCPPYADLEKYSDLEGDISNMKYEDFLVAYRGIIRKSCDKLKEGGFAIFVVGEVRDKHGNYYGFVPDTIKAFMNCGMHYYNEAILSVPTASAAIRAPRNMRTHKLVKVHQNILIFKK